MKLFQDFEMLLTNLPWPGEHFGMVQKHNSNKGSTPMIIKVTSCCNNNILSD